MNIVNKKSHKKTWDDVYVGRGSPLGNPYTHINDRETQALFIVESRAEAIRLYKIWLLDKIHAKDIAVLKALDKIKSDTNIVCHCVPLACHGSVIRDIVEFFKESEEILPYDK